MNIEQLSTPNKYEIPPHIEAIDARLAKGMTDEQLADLEYQFRVIYTIDAASKSRAHLEFIRPESVEGEDIRNVLVKYKAADDLFPHKPTRVCQLVRERSGKTFSIHNHTQAWQLFKVRPPAKAKQPQNTNKDYCIYHPAHGDYTYSDKWVDRLIEEIADDQRLATIRAVKIG